MTALLRSTFEPVEELSAKDYTVIVEPPYPPNWHMVPHRHVQHELSLIRGGACRIILGDELRTLHAGDAFFIPSGTSHGFVSHSQKGVEILVVQFNQLDPRLVESLIDSYPIGRVRLSDLERSCFVDLCHRLQREIAGNLPYAAIHCRALIEQLAVLMLRSSSRGEGPSLTPEQQRAIELALEWMSEHAHDNILINDVAAYVGLSPAHFRQIFHRYMNVSPKQYLLALRLQASKCLLMQVDRSVAEVAALSGFGSPQKFSKTFRSLTGLTPMQWRKAYLFPQ